jgi:lipid-A-disaccharide synthase-like uncharacterized protein
VSTDRRGRVALLRTGARASIASLLVLAALSGVAGTARAQDPAPPAAIDLRVRLKDVRVKHALHGDTLYVPTDDGVVELTPEEFSYALGVAQNEMESSGFLYRFFNITKPWSFAWIALGFAGQALFTFRMVLQWYASEKEKRSVIPVAFWWGSLFGGMLLFVYFVWRKDIVGIVGQSTGIFVYARNLVLIHRGTPAVSAN